MKASTEGGISLHSHLSKSVLWPMKTNDTPQSSNIPQGEFEALATKFAKLKMIDLTLIWIWKSRLDRINNYPFTYWLGYVYR